MTTLYTLKQMICVAVGTWQNCQRDFNSNYDPEDTLEFIKEVCGEWGIEDEKFYKEIFDEMEDPYYMNLETSHIMNRDDEEEITNYASGPSNIPP